MCHSPERWNSAAGDVLQYMEGGFDAHLAIRLARRWAPLVLFLVLLGGGLAFLFGSRQPADYDASGLIRVAQPVQIGSQGAPSSSDVNQTDAVLVTQDSVLSAVIADLHLNETPAQLRDEVSATAGPSSELVTVTAEGTNGSREAGIVNAVMSEYSSQVTKQTEQAIDQAGASLQAQINTLSSTLKAENAQLAQLQASHQDTTVLQQQVQADQATLTQLTANYSSFRAQQALGFEHVTVAAPATVPTEPINQRKVVDAAIGATAGLLIGVAIAVLLQLLDQGLRTEDDVRVRLGLPVLGIVPVYARKRGQPADRRSTIAGEAYRQLRTSLLFAGVDKPIKSVVVTSARLGEGKSRTAANLAGVVAAAGTRVLLVDADMRHPTQHQLFQRSRHIGLSELLLSSAGGNPPNLNGQLNTGHPNLSLLTSGTIPPNPAELLASRAAESALHHIESLYELVIIDTPPVDAVTDALSLAAHASATVVVVESGSSDARHLLRTVERLREVGANVIGVVLNKSRRIPEHRYYEYYVVSDIEDKGIAEASAPVAAAHVWEPVPGPR
ncbi:MAG: polysaccharide biosynthesis tyrosine autokinase [Candidatus Dormibacteraeota bacterium]|nr:polysaccharide biosynthesis tyrosine autokinase [Candidatus Dormibacteraeota bacterium]